MSTEGLDWVEIIEPRTRDVMYANLITGECVWDPPDNVDIKRTNDNQWWELFDSNTHRFYYYNVASQTTVWHRPLNCDIIPLAKLQTLKQFSIEPEDKRTNAVINSGKKASGQSRSHDFDKHPELFGENKSCRHRTPRANVNSNLENLFVDPKMCPQSMSFSHSSDLSAATSRYSPTTPVLVKKANLSQNSRLYQPAPKEHGKVASGKLSISRSGSFMSSPSSHCSRKQEGGTAAGDKTPLREYLGMNSDDESMHEKYFKSVESTPSRRRPTTSQTVGGGVTKKSSGSSSRSPTSPVGLSKISSIGHCNSNTMNSSPRKISDSKFNLDLTSKPERYMDKMRLSTDMEKTSPGSLSNTSGLSLQHQQKHKVNMKADKLVSKSGVSPSSQYSSMEHRSGNSLNRSASSVAQSYSLNKSNLERHNQGNSGRNDRPVSDSIARVTVPLQSFPPEDIDYECPLYSNWDQEHLLPLQHYIIEQAKLSGYRLGAEGVEDSADSLCDSQSEHSFSGHEPDNEDSDNSEGRGDYLAHTSYGMFAGDYGKQNYYNVNYNRNDKEDIPSSEVDAKLEGARDGGKVYSLGNSRPYFQRDLTAEIAPPLRSASPVQMAMVTQLATQQQSVANKRPMERANTSAHHLILNREEYPNQPIYGTQFGPVASLAIMKETDIEKFAQDNLNLHSKGIFRKKSSVRDMLSWTSDAISRPMLALARDKAGKKMATELFKLVQIYMGDRKARQGMTLNSVAIDIIATAVTQPQLRDELYVQLCRQTTENPLRESMIRGWELMAICLSFLPPSPTFQPALLNYMKRHHDPSFATTFPEFEKWPIHVQVSHYATIACRRLDRIGSSGKRKTKKPTEDEVNQARHQIFRDSMFGNTLDEIMMLQRERFPEQKLPWIQVVLSEQVLFMGGKETEGIFRVPADVDEVSYLKCRLDLWETPDIPSMDPHAPAGLLKLWYRELYDPLIPDDLYDECVNTEDPAEAAAIVDRLPSINRSVLKYLIHFLQQFAKPDVVIKTKMDSSNLAMVFAPNCLRCLSQDPKVILENARKEMAFLRTLITNMDTADVEY